MAGLGHFQETEGAQMVEQFLLQHGYHLTALELLVESQAQSSECAQHFPELENFFQDPGRFPPDEIARHSHANALDYQAQARDREQLLQLSEYELRLAKEDLADMGRKLAEAQSQASAAKLEQQQGIAPAPQTKSSEDSSLQQHGRHDDTGQHLGSLQDATASFDWSRIGKPSANDFKEINSSIVAFLVWQGYKTSALTLREEAGVGDGPTPQPCATQPQQHPGLAVWRWFQLARSPVAQQGLELLVEEASTEAIAAQAAASEHARVESLQELLSQAQAEAAAARAQATTLAQDAAQLRVKVEALQAAAVAAADSRPKESTSRSSLEDPTAVSAVQVQQPEAELHSSTATALSTLEQEQLQQQQKHILALATIMTQLTELLPRIMPALTIKSRLEMLPMVQTVILATLDPEIQRALVGLVFNGVATPDPAQRGAVVGLCAGVASVLGPTWASQEVLSMCTKQASSPSTERRVLVAEQLHALLNPGEPSALVDLSVTSHTLLPQLHRLAEDRMEQVREAALKGLVTLLGPNRLAFSRHYYVMLEEVLLQLVQDGVEDIAQDAITSFLPALQDWAASGNEEALLTSSLLPRVVSEAGRHVRLGTTATSPLPANPALQHSTLDGASAPGTFGTLSASPPPSLKGPLTPAGLMPCSSYGLASTPHSALQFNAKRFACYDYQAAHQLLEVYCILQPTLREYALRNCPAWAVPATAPDAMTVKGGSMEEPPQQPSDLGQPNGTQQPDQQGGASAEAAEKELQSNGDGSAPPDLASPSASTTRHRRNCSLDTPGAWSPAQSQHSCDTQQQYRQTGLPTCRSVDGLSSRAAEALAAAWPRAADPDVAVVDVHELVQAGTVNVDALIGAWVRSGQQHTQWKAIHWVMQFLLPELLDAINALPSPPLPSPASHLHQTSSPTPLTSSTATSGQTSVPAKVGPVRTNSELARAEEEGAAAESGRGARDPGKEVRVQLGCALHALATAFGPLFSRCVLVPICSAAAGACNAGPAPEDPSPQTICFVGEAVAPHVQEAALGARPGSPESAVAARERMLPLLLGLVLPACGEGKLSSWLVFVSNHASHTTNAWLGQSLQEFSKAVAFSCTFNESCVLEMMQVLEHMVGQSAQGISSEMGLLGLALARGVLPVPEAREHLARRIMPFVMVLLSNGDVEMQLACVDVLLEVLQRYWDDEKLVEQVFVVYDGLLEQSPPEVQCAVLGAGQQLAKVVAPKATRSPAAAAQIEWLLQASLSMAKQLCSAPDTPEQKRALASQLAHVTHTIHVHDVSLPRLQAALQACAETLQRSRALLPEGQYAAVLAITNAQAAAKAGSSLISQQQQQQQQQQMQTQQAAAQQAAAQQQVAIQQAKQYQQQQQQQQANAPGVQPQPPMQQLQQQQQHMVLHPPRTDPCASLASSGSGPLGNMFAQTSNFLQPSQQQQRAQQQQQGEESSFSSRFQRFKSKFRRGPENQPGGASNTQQPPVICMPYMGAVVGPPYSINAPQADPQQPQVQLHTPLVYHAAPQSQPQPQEQPPPAQQQPAPEPGSAGNGMPSRSNGHPGHPPSWLPSYGKPEGSLPVGAPGTRFLSESDEEAL